MDVYSFTSLEAERKNIKSDQTTKLKATVEMYAILAKMKIIKPR